MQTDKHNKANSCSLQFSEHTKTENHALYFMLVMNTTININKIWSVLVLVLVWGAREYSSH